MVLKLSETRVYVYKDGYEVWSAPVGIGRTTPARPPGATSWRSSRSRARRLRPDRAQPQRPLRGHPELAGSGDAITAFHGPFGAEELIRSGGGKVSNGCVRMLPEDQIKMDGIALGTPVDILP